MVLSSDAAYEVTLTTVAVEQEPLDPLREEHILYKLFNEGLLPRLFHIKNVNYGEFNTFMS